MTTNMSLVEQKDLDSLGSEQSPFVSQDTRPGNQGEDSESWHLLFRGFISKEQCDPIQDLRLISKLCHQWLRPDLHTKEEILEQLVLEQFMISVPQEVQVLVKESGVKTCEDLEKVLKNSRHPKKWSIVFLEGKAFLLQDSEAELAKAKARGWAEVESSQERNSTDSEESLSEGQASPGSQNLSETEEPSSSEEEETLPEIILEKEDPQHLRPKQTQENREAGTALNPQDLQPPQSPDSVWENGEKLPQKGLNTNDVAASCSVQERRDLAQNLDLRSRLRLKTVSSDNTPPFQGRPGPVSPVESVGHPNGQKAERQSRFECIVCSKQFVYKSQLIIHWRSHSGERPFRCGFCKKGFSQSSDLRVHQRIHTGEKPYKCGLCGKMFAHESTLLGHSRVHTKEKPFKCGDCHRCFSHKGNLNVHRRVHTNVRPYTCQECGSTFRQQGTFKRHLQIHLRKE